MNAARGVLMLVAMGLTVASCRDAPVAPAPVRAISATGEDLYSTLCAVCHGPEGRGDGIAAPVCRVSPADLTRAEFKVRATPAGALPRDADLAAVIRLGAGGDGAMPPFSFLTEGDNARLVTRVKAFSPRWQREQAAPDVVLPPRVAGDVREGERVYRNSGCVECHGLTGDGNGPRAKGLRNARGLLEMATDLTRPWTFKGGATTSALSDPC